MEESPLTTLPAKHELALAVLDPDAEATEVDLTSGVEELKRRLEILLGTKPEAPEDQSMKEQVHREAEELARKERIANAGGELVGAAFTFLGEIFSGREDTEKSLQLEKMFKERLSECLERREDGSLRMTIALPDEAALDAMSTSLAKMITV